MNKTIDVIDDLLGTCCTLENAIYNLGYDEKDIDEVYLYNEIFCCTECGWWCEITEDTGNNICSECAEECCDED